MKKIYTLIFSLVIFLSAQNVFSQGLVINEFDYDQVQQDSAEFIELYNSSSSPIDLGLYSVILVNGNMNAIYNTIPLPSQFLNPSSYFVICGFNNVVPFCDLVLPDSLTSNVLQNGSPDAIAIIENSSSNIIDVVSYEGTMGSPYFETTGIPPGINTSDSGLVNFVGISRFPDGMDLNDNSQDFHLVCITPGSANVNTTTNCQQPLSVPNLTSRNNFMIYPNPTRGFAIVDLNGIQLNNASLIINNVLGKEVKRISLKNSEIYKQIDLSELLDGVYYVKLKTTSAEKTQRIIVRK